jgi:chlorobactene glucosyltransferase
MSLLELSTAEVVLVLMFWLIVGRLWYRQCVTQLPRVPRGVPCQWEQPPLVSIIVPARNEAHQIVACVQSLLTQDYPRFEVIAVDDCSEDDTGAILTRLAATDPRLTVVSGRPLPEGWMGKIHALYQGYQIAKGDWLLFTDADTTHTPGLLSGVMALLRPSTAACATVVGHQHAPGCGAHLMNVAVFTSIFMLTDLRKYRDPKSPVSTLNGQYIIFARRAYEAIGTHAAVRHFPSDDAALGYLTKLSGFIPLVIDGGDRWRGWSRSMINNMWTVLGPSRGSVLLILLTVIMGLFWVVPWVLGIYGMVWGDRSALTVGSLQIFAGLAVLYIAGGRWLSAVRDAIVMPLSVILLTAMVWGGLAQAWHRGGMMWKGRIMRIRHCLPPWNPQELRIRD